MMLASVRVRRPQADPGRLFPLGGLVAKARAGMLMTQMTQNTSMATADPPSDAATPADPAASSSPSSPSDGRSLKRRAMRGSVWTIGGYGTSQVLRLGSNLILTRLLFPEAFGLMALVNVFMQGLAMFSDVGIGPAIVQNPRGEERRFLDTAWTIQVGRGFCLWACAALFAWPAARFFDKPELAALIPVAGAAAAIAGFNSTKLFVANRRVVLGRLTMIELTSQVIGLVALVGLAWWMRSVWALVIGGLITAFFKAALGHFALPGRMDHFHWDRDSARELFGFGKWIFFASILGFISLQGDRVVFGRYLSSAELGLFSIAVLIADTPKQVINQLSQRVVFGAMAQVHRDRPHAVQRNFYRARVGLDSLLMGVGILVFSGPQIVTFLFDPRYEPAGWMLQLVAVRTTFFCLSRPTFALATAMGKPQAMMWKHVVTLPMIVIGMPIGFEMGGIVGALFVVALSEVPGLILSSAMLMRAKVFTPVLELRGVGFLIVGVTIGWGIAQLGA